MEENTPRLTSTAEKEEKKVGGEFNGHFLVTQALIARGWLAVRPRAPHFQGVGRSYNYDEEEWPAGVVSPTMTMTTFSRILLSTFSRHLSNAKDAALAGDARVLAGIEGEGGGTSFCPHPTYPSLPPSGSGSARRRPRASEGRIYFAPRLPPLTRAARQARVPAAAAAPAAASERANDYSDPLETDLTAAVSPVECG